MPGGWRLRPCIRWLSSASEKPAFAENPVFRRLADKHFRSQYAVLHNEAVRYRKDGVVRLKPSVDHFLVWLKHRQSARTSHVALDPRSLPPKLAKPALQEVGIFHLLTAIHSDPHDSGWRNQQKLHLENLVNITGGQFPKESPDAKAISDEFEISDQQIIAPALNLVSSTLAKHESIASSVIPWLKSLSAPSVSAACVELTNLSNIPAFVTADILLRTPMSRDELQLQLDLWQTFMASICRDFHEKPSHLSSILHNLVFYIVQLDPHQLPAFIQTSMAYLISKKSGYRFKVVSPEFINSLIYFSATSFIRNSSRPGKSPMPIIRAHEILVGFLSHPKLSQKGYLGIVLTIYHESKEKALKLFDIANSHFRDHSDLYHLAQIWLSETPEQLLHNFNSGIARYPKSADMWLFMVKKLGSMDLLNEKRSQALLLEILSRKSEMIISKDLMLALLAPISTINGMEQFISQLEKAHILEKFANSIHNKYMALLYKHGDEKNVRKPYLDRRVRNSSNLECARHLYKENQWKTVSCVGVMLNGEVNGQPENVFKLYNEELAGRTPDEGCLYALLRASLKKRNGAPILWGQLYASQVAVHEFKMYVQQPEQVGIYPSDHLWRMYIRCLSSADYTAELADIIRWWEAIGFHPSRSTLQFLLDALPQEFADRHIRHARSTGSQWPWPE